MLKPGATLFHNQYRIVRHVKTGGQAIVYEGYDSHTDRTVAIKQTLQNEKWAHEALKREARLLANLHHQALPPVYNCFFEYESAFVVMRFIPGDDLDTLLKSKGETFTTEEILGWTQQLLNALQHLQERGIVHRDINPRNLKLDGRDQIVLLDFGIAKDSSSKTPIVGGSKHYAPPEQLKDEGTDARSDLYSLAATIYHLLTAIPPPDAVTRALALLKGHSDPLRPIQEVNQEVAPRVANVFMRAMSLDRDKRQSTVALMSLELREAIQISGAPSNAMESMPEGKVAARNKTNPDTIVASTPPLFPSTTNNSNEIRQRRRITIQLPEHETLKPPVTISTSNPVITTDRKLNPSAPTPSYFRKLFSPIGQLVGSLKKSTVGLDIGSSALKAIELKPTKSGFKLLHLAHQELQFNTVIDEQIIDFNYISDTINHIWNEHDIVTNRVVASVSGPAVIVKNIIVPMMTAEELEESIYWIAEEHIPFDIKDVVLDYNVTSHDPDGQHLNVLLAASKRDKIAQIRQVISRAGKQPVIIDVSAIAIQNAYNVNYRPTSNQTVALIDIGASAMTINIIQGSDSHFIRHISVGGNNYTEALQKELGLTFEQTEMLKRGERVDPNLSTMRVNSMLHSITVTLMNKIQETFELFQRTNISSPVIDRMLISGGSSRILHLVESLSDNFQMPVELFDSFRLINIDYERFDSTLIKSLSPIFAVAMGLATRVGRYAR